jgi:two-component system chemotaxis response regulator CheV
MSDDFNALEIGSSLFELIEFSLDRETNGEMRRGIYGVNVAKVREVVRMPEINPLSSRVRGIAGVFELRGIPIPAVHLAVALGDESAKVNKNQQVIVAEFSMRRAGFIVDQTHRIRRLAWDKIMPPTADSETFINGMTLIEGNQFLFILDLERILLSLEEKSIAPQLRMAAGYPMGYPQQMMMPAPYGMPQHEAQQANGQGAHILLVDDSLFILNSTKSSLLKAGYSVVTASDGQSALALLNDANVKGRGRRVDMVVTDVEMPRMDGLTLTSKIRESDQLKQLPVILHTSLSGDSTQSAGMRVGANGYVVKNDIKFLIEMVKEVMTQTSAG